MGRFRGGSCLWLEPHSSGIQWGLASKSKSIKDGWEVSSSCRIGFLGELTGVGVFPNTASIVGQSVGASWINGCSQEGGVLY
jgi:hypothetical protein